MRSNIEEANNFDAIIIGAGLGGLTAGAILARKGKRVLVVEQHSIPGGCATGFRRKDAIVEVGLNQTGGFEEFDIKTKALKSAGVLGRIELVRNPEFFRRITDKRDFVLPDNAGKAEEYLASLFPDERRGLKKFFRTIDAVRKEIHRYADVRPDRQNAILPLFPLLFPSITANCLRTVGSFLNSCFRSEELKSLLISNLAYFHNDPRKMSLLYFCAGQGEFFGGGAYFIRGGSQKLSDSLAEAIVSNGGAIEYRHQVTKVITDKNRAIGIEYKNLKSIESAKESAFAPAILAGCALPVIANILSEESAKKRLLKRIGKAENSCSFFTVFLEFNETYSTIHNRHYATFVNENTEFNIEDTFSVSTGDFLHRPFYFCDYETIDSGLYDSQATRRGVICASDTMDGWQNLEAEAYSERKNRFANALIGRMDRILPGFAKSISRMETATPKTIMRYTSNPDGAVFGFAQNVRSAVPFRTHTYLPIKGLFTSSAWGFPGGGFTGAIMSGYNAARAVLAE